jgi:signal transduction histidine kinase
MKYFLLLCLSLLLLVPVVSGQGGLSDYSVRYFTSENGLPQNSVKAIARDDYGFIWLATESGMVRFDGNSFKQFDKRNTGILTSRMTDIRRCAGTGELMAVSNDDELLLISKGKATKTGSHFKDFFLPATARGINQKPVTWLHRVKGLDKLLFSLSEQLGALIIFHHGISWYPKKGNVRYTSIPSIQDSDEIFPVNHFVYRGAPGFAGDTLQCITPDGITCVKLTGDFVHLPARSTIKDYVVETYQANNQTFLYAGEYLYQLIRSGDGSIDTKLLLQGFDINKQLIYCAYYDSLHQRLFMGSLLNGLYILDRKKFRTAVYSGKGANSMTNVVYDQVVFNDSSVMTGNGTILYTNPAVPPGYKKLDGYNSKQGLDANPLFRSRDGSIWVCCPYKIYRLGAVSVKKQEEWPCILPRTMTEGKDGRLWIGTGYAGLYAIDPHKPKYKPQLFLSIPGDVMSLEWEGDQLLWICTTKYLLRFNIKTRATDTIHALTDKMTRGVYIPKPGEVWICTYEDGLFLWQNGKLTHFPTRNYPHLKTVNKILEDDQGYFWISTNYGIYLTRRSDLLTYANNNPGTQEEPYLYYYSKESGFLTNEFNGGSQQVGTKLRNGYFSFSSMNGVVFFKPAGIPPELPDNKVIIDKVEVDGQEMQAEGLIRLNRKFRTLKIIPGSAYMGNIANLTYQFKVNDDADWSNTYNGAVILSSLPNGHNHIYIRKKAGFGVGNHIDYELTFYIPPAWWQTRWFFISAFTALIIVVWLIIRIRVHRWKKRNRLLEMAVHSRTEDLKTVIRDLERSENSLGGQLAFQQLLNENITHDIVTPLKYLKLFTGNVLTNAEERNSADISELEHIHRGANQIYEVVENLNRYMKSRLSEDVSMTRFSIHQLVDKKMKLFIIAAKEQNNIIENRTDPALFIRQNESMFSVILHNLIDNAIKNTKNGTIEISTSEEGGTVVLRVEDAGKGMTPAQINVFNNYFMQLQPGGHHPGIGFGFMIIKEIASLLRLEIRLERLSEKGVSIRVLIPQSGL